MLAHPAGEVVMLLGDAAGQKLCADERRERPSTLPHDNERCNKVALHQLTGKHQFVIPISLHR